MTETPVQSFAESNQHLVEAFERWLVAKNYSASTHSQYIKTARKFASHVDSRDITAADIRTLRDFLAEHSRTPNIYRATRIALRAFYKFLQLGGRVSMSPAARIGARKQARRVPRFLPETDVENLIYATVSLRDRALIELLYASGLRAQEVCNLDIEDLQLSAGTFRVRRGKGDKDRVAMVGRKAVEALSFYLGKRKSGPVFLSRSGKRLVTATVYQVVRNVARHAGLDGVHPHTLRHSFATVLMDHGADIRHVQELLGHERISTTAIYLHSTIANLRKVHERCHPHSEGATTDEPKK